MPPTSPTYFFVVTALLLIIVGVIEEAAQLGKRWDHWQQENLTQQEDRHLLIIQSPYRALVRPLLAYIDTVHERHPNVTLSVVLPDYVIVHWWEYLLHNQTIFRLKAALRLRPGIVVIDVPQHLEHERRPAYGGQ